jgi:trehalose 6-phosphate phosphatase
LAESPPNRSNAPPWRDGDALFLDFDGTLLALQDDPYTVQADPALLERLSACDSRLGGALAIVSGRTLATIDACLAPLRLAAAGLHGLERRDASGKTSRLSVERERLRQVAQQISLVMETLPMTLLEDKGASLALHWRRAPEHRGALRALAQEALQELGPQFRLLHGNHVYELLPRIAGKGHAVQAFLGEAPFKGRRPIFVGDDQTDLDGFAAAREAGGFGIAVGGRIEGDYSLSDVGAVQAWMAGSAHA